MDDKTKENTTIESEQNIFYDLEQWHTIESAASLMALGRIVKGKEWQENEKIQAAHKALYDEAYKVEEYLQGRMKLGDVFTWVRSSPYVAEEIKKYPDIGYSEILPVMERIFDMDVDIYKNFNEICSSLHAEYGATLVCNETVTDLEEFVGYRYPQKVKAAKIAEAAFMIIRNAVLAEADKFGLLPDFTLDEETEPSYFYFYPVSFKPDPPSDEEMELGYSYPAPFKPGTSKGCLKVKKEGIKAWLECKNIPDKHYNKTNRKSEIDTPATTAPKSAAMSETGESSTLPPIPWKGNKSDFACLVKYLFDNEFIDAKDARQAYEITLRHFSGIDSNPHSLNTLAGKSNSDRTNSISKVIPAKKKEK